MDETSYLDTYSVFIGAMMNAATSLSLVGENVPHQNWITGPSAYAVNELERAVDNVKKALRLLENRHCEVRDQNEVRLYS